METDARLEQFRSSYITYAGTMTLFAITTSTSLQALIYVCTQYAKRWIFSFGPDKYKPLSYRAHQWCIVEYDMAMVDKRNILDVTFTHKG